MLAIQVDPQLEVRLLQQEDTEALVALVAANRGLRWLDWWATREGNEAAIRDSLLRFEAGQGFWAGIWTAGELAGVVGLSEIHAWNRSAKLHCWLGAAFQGRGIMTRACQGLLRYAFTSLGLNRIQLHCATANRRSRALAERVGFHREGTLRRAERFNPAVHAREDFRPDEIAEVRPGSGEYFFDHAVYGLVYEGEA